MSETFTPYAPLNLADTAATPGAKQLPSDSEQPSELELAPQDAPESGTHTTVFTSHPIVDISRHLKAPKLSNVKPNTVSYEQAHNGINISIPGSAQMRYGDTLVFNWGESRSSTQLLLHEMTRETTVRVLCITYDVTTPAQYGVVDVFYEVHRDNHRIGTSPALKVTVNSTPKPPTTPARAHRKTRDDKEGAA